MSHYLIPTHQLPKLRRRVKALRKRADKIGCSSWDVNYLGSTSQSYADEVTGHCRVRMLERIELVGIAPIIHGYDFVASILHTKAGNLILRAPNHMETELPLSLRDDAPTCDHCKTKRARKTTFVLRDTYGNFIRIGRNCLKDYLGLTDLEGALGIWSLVKDLNDLDWTGDTDVKWSGPTASHVVDFVAAAFRAVELHGWAKSSAERSTADQAAWAVGPRPSHHPEYSKEWDTAQPTDDHVKQALEAIAWITTVTTRNEYEYNLQTAVKPGVVLAKTQGLIASLTVAHKRYLDREASNKLALEASNKSKHCGNVGCRYARRLVVTKTHESHGEFGRKVMYAMQDMDGNLFKWWSSGGCWLTDEQELKTGDCLWFTFKVKRHGKAWVPGQGDVGGPETLIERASASVGRPEFKWMTEDGQIFKTRKSMKAA